MTVQKAQLPSIVGTDTLSGSAWVRGSLGSFTDGAFYANVTGSAWVSSDDAAGDTIKSLGFDSSRSGASKDVNGENIYTNGGENRPMNYTVRIWKRTA